MITVKNGHSSFYSTATVAIHILHNFRYDDTFGGRTIGTLGNDHTYDIVIGPIADDGVTYQLRRYSMGDISMSRLIEELKYANGLTIQYYFGTEHALSYLKKL